MTHRLEDAKNFEAYTTMVADIDAIIAKVRMFLSLNPRLCSRGVQRGVISLEEKEDPAKQMADLRVKNLKATESTQQVALLAASLAVGDVATAETVGTFLLKVTYIVVLIGVAASCASAAALCPVQPRGAHADVQPHTCADRACIPHAGKQGLPFVC